VLCSSSGGECQLSSVSLLNDGITGFARYIEGKLSIYIVLYTFLLFSLIPFFLILIRGDKSFMSK